MSGLEVLSVVACVVQLINVSVKVADTIRMLAQRFRQEPVKFQGYLHHVQHLISAAKIIKETRGLHTDLICSHIHALLTDAQRLERILSKVLATYKCSLLRRYWTTLGGQEVKSIEIIFCGLEKEKTALILIITSSGTETLDRLHRALDRRIDSISSYTNHSHIMPPLQQGPNVHVDTTQSVTHGDENQLALFKDIHPEANSSSQESEPRTGAAVDPRQTPVENIARFQYMSVGPHSQMFNQVLGKVDSPIPQQTDVFYGCTTGNYCNMFNAPISDPNVLDRLLEEQKKRL